MKRSFCVILAIILAVSLLSISTSAMQVGKNAVSVVDEITLGQIQEMIVDYFGKHRLNFEVGTDLFYQFAVEQVYSETESALHLHPDWKLIRAYLIRYQIVYQEYIYCKEVMRQDEKNGLLLLEETIEDNSCLAYDIENKELSFSVTDSFLKETIGEIREKNRIKIKEAEKLASEIAQRYAVTSYSVTNAVNYANTYAITSNDMYPALLKDCTNFVSQCVYAGGVPMHGYNNVTGTYTSTTQWYCYCTDSQWHANYNYRYYAYTTSWINADDFCSYMTIYANKKMVVDSIGELYEHCEVGDVVQLVERVTDDVHHSVIITAKDSTTAYYNARTRNRVHADIEEHFDDGEDYFIIFSFKPQVSTSSIDECGQCGEVPDEYYTELYSNTLDRVIECPRHSTHDAEVYQKLYKAYCSIHDNFVGYISETEYVCLN